jgi:hypothetical protein
MTLSLAYIVVAGLLLVFSWGAAGYYFYQNNRLQPTKESEKATQPATEKLFSEITAIKEHLHTLDLHIDKFNLKFTELEEFVTRGMNRMSARHSKMTKKEEEEELKQKLLEQSKQSEMFNGDEEVQTYNPGQRPRLIKRS